MSEKAEDILAKILNLCESNPDVGLEFIEQTIRDKPESDPTHSANSRKQWHMGAKVSFNYREANRT